LSAASELPLLLVSLAVQSTIKSETAQEVT